MRRHAWSGMRTRDLPFTRGAVAALNLVSCGATAGAVTPCWFPDQPALTLTDRSGASRVVPLDGLPVVAPEVLLASDNPRRPVRDALVTAENACGCLDREPSAVISRPGWRRLWRSTNSTDDCFRRVQCRAGTRSSGGRDDLLASSWDGAWGGAAVIVHRAAILSGIAAGHVRYWRRRERIDGAVRSGGTEGTRF